MNSIRRAFFALLISALGAAGPYSTLRAAPLYQLTDIGSLSGTETYAYGINAAGEVAGYANVPGNSQLFRAFRYSNGQINDLGTLGHVGAFAHGINDQGQVAGSSPPTASSDHHAFVWTPGGTGGPPSNPQMRDIGSLGGTYAVGRDINNVGQIVGVSTMSGVPFQRAFLWTPGGTGGPPSNPQMKDLGILPGQSPSEALGLNDGGHVVGHSNDQGFFYDGSTMIGVGTLGGGRSPALAVNNLDQVVGASDVLPNGLTPYLWTIDGTDGVATNPRMRNLGSLGGLFGSASDINDAGQVVGESLTSSNATHAFLWTTAQGMLDLNDLVNASAAGWVLQVATGINERGQIVGYGQHLGQTRSFVLTPVPEPSTAVLLCAGSLCIALAAIRQRCG